MPKGRPLRRPNGTGTVATLSGRRRCPYEVRVNTRMDDRNYPIYDVLGRFTNRIEAQQVLDDYLRSPYDVSVNNLTFSDVYEMWYKSKYVNSKKKYSISSINCTKAAYSKCSSLYNRKFKDIRTPELQAVLDNHDLSHAYLEHIQNLFRQIYKYAMQYDYIIKDYSEFAEITKKDDDKPGIPFTEAELQKLWNNKDKPFVDSVLIFIYSGWRVSELLPMLRKDIDLQARTFRGGIKTAASKNRIVPIHSKIYEMVCTRYSEEYPVLFGVNEKAIDNKDTFYPLFNRALISSGITTKHTPHDCRHTFATLLDNAGANPTSIKRLMGHSSGSNVTEKIYTHKDIEQLRKAIELI